MKSKAFLAVLVALAMLISFGLSVKEAKADAILFPWVVKSSAVSTLISVVNTAGVDGIDDPYDLRLHYQYWYKRTTANGQTEVCDPVSFKRPTSKDDIVTFDAAGNINGGKALFNDPSPYGGASFQLNVTAPRRAFLIVDNNTPAFVRAGTNVSGTLYGEAIVLEIAGGAAWGYIAMPASDGVKSSQSAQVFFNNPPKVIDSGTLPRPAQWTVTTLLPPDNASTKFFVTPIDLTANGDDTAAGQRKGNANVRVQLLVSEPAHPDGFYGGLFDNDENVIDFVRIKNIVCTSADDLSAFISEGAWNLFKATGGQGWTVIRTRAGNIDQSPVNATADNPETAAVIGKLEYTTGGMTIDGKAIPGTFNNFQWLEISEVENYIGGEGSAPGTGCPTC